jgi:hypothetical protein
MATSQSIIDTAYCFNFWVFGGYVRDVVLLEKGTSNDIDIGCSKAQEAGVSQFLRVLATRYNVEIKFDSKVKKMPTGYGQTSPCLTRQMKVLVDDISIDICVFTSFNDWDGEETCDFSCNLFYQTRDTHLALRYIPYDWKYTPNPMAELIKMTKEKKFMAIYKPVSTTENIKEEVSQINILGRRGLRLVRDGWTLIDELYTDEAQTFIADVLIEDTVMHKAIHGKWDLVDQILEDRTMDEVEKALPEYLSDAVRTAMEIDSN